MRATNAPMWRSLAALNRCARILWWQAPTTDQPTYAVAPLTSEPACGGSGGIGVWRNTGHIDATAWFIVQADNSQQLAFEAKEALDGRWFPLDEIIGNPEFSNSMTPRAKSPYPSCRYRPVTNSRHGTKRIR